MLPLYGGGFAAAAAQVSAVYYGTAVLLHCLVPLALPVKSIQVQARQPGQASREALYSLGPLAIKAAVLWLVEQICVSGISRLYEGPVDTPAKALYVLATVAALDVLHDAWFYWTHRLLHWRPLYRHVHFIHHRSVAPSAFAGYSFHVAEAALVFANEVLVCFLFPIHAGVHRAYHLATTAIHIGAARGRPRSAGGHAGYEIAPFIPSLEAGAALLCAAARRCVAAMQHEVQELVSGAAQACKEGGHAGSGGGSNRAARAQPRGGGGRGAAGGVYRVLKAAGAAGAPCAALNTVRHHDMHHRFPTRHFSLYFTHWDRWCGTEHPGYARAVREHFLDASMAPEAVASAGCEDAAAAVQIRNGCVQRLPVAPVAT